MGGLRAAKRRPAAAPGRRRPRHGRGVLFLCVANSARSQMAEGIARSLAPRGLRVFSAGSDPTTVHPMAVQVMKEVGIDIAGQASKPMAAVPAPEVGWLVTLCDEKECPVFPAPVERIHWPVPDPAAKRGSRRSRLQAFRRVRSELRFRIGALLETIQKGRA